MTPLPCRKHHSWFESDTADYEPARAKEKGKKTDCALLRCFLRTRSPARADSGKTRERGGGGNVSAQGIFAANRLARNAGRGNRRAPTEDGQRGQERVTPKQDKQTHNSRRERAPSGRTAGAGAGQKKKAPQLPKRGLPERPRRALWIQQNPHQEPHWLSG